MARKKPESDVQRPVAKCKDPFWIYPGERRPIVVQASTQEIAMKRVQESPHYDGFPAYAEPVEKFSDYCTPAGGWKTKDEPRRTASDVLEEPKDLFLLVKVVDGKVQKVRMLTSQDQAIKTARKTKEHLDEKTDAIALFALRGEVPILGSGLEFDLEELKIEEKRAEEKKAEVQS